MASIAVIGGTGHLGKGIARRLAQGGHRVTIGSRAADKAEGIAADMNAELGLALGFGANTDVAQAKDVVTRRDTRRETFCQRLPSTGDPGWCGHGDGVRPRLSRARFLRINV